MPTTSSVNFSIQQSTRNLTISDETTLNVSSYIAQSNTLTLSTAAGTGPFDVTVNLPAQYGGFTDRLVVGTGIRLKVVTAGRWNIDAANALSTDITVNTAATLTTPAITGSTTGPNRVVVAEHANVGTITGGAAADDYTIHGNVTAINTGAGPDHVTIGMGGIVSTLGFGAGTNTVTTTGSGKFGTLSFGAGTNTAHFNGTGSMGLVNLGGGTNLLSFTGATHVDVVSAAAGTGPTTIEGHGTIGRLESGAGNDSFTITHTDFTQASLSTQIATGDGHDSLTFNGTVGLSNAFAAPNAIDTGTGHDTITISADGRLSLSGLARDIEMGDGNDSFTLAAGADATLGTLHTGAGSDTITLTDGNSFTGTIATGSGGDTISVSNGRIIGDIDTGSGSDRVTLTGAQLAGRLDTGASDDEAMITASTLRDIDMGGGDDRLTIRDSVVNGDIDMGGGNDSVMIGQTTPPPVAPEDLWHWYAINPAAQVNGDIDLGTGGLKTLTIGDGVRINGLISAGKSLSTPVASTIEIGNYVTLDDTDFSVSLGHGDDHVTIGHHSYISGQILLNGGNNTLIVQENAMLSSSTVAIYGGLGDDHVTLHDGVIVKGAIALSAGTNTLLVGNNVTFTESGTVYSSADVGDGGQDVIRFGSGVTIRGNIYTGWGTDVVYMTEGAVGLHETSHAIISGGELGETGYGDLLVVGAFFPQSVLVGKYSYNPDTGLWHANREIDEDFTFNGINYRNFEVVKYAPPTCFTPGTLIETAQGPRLVEDIRVGDLVQTRDNGLQAVRKILRTHFDTAQLQANPRHLPVRIAAGALGRGLPLRDLVVSPQHRVLVASPIAQRITQSAEVLLPAVQLCNWPGIARSPVSEIVYLHLVFDRHELIISEGAVTEAFYPGPAALNGFDAAVRAEFDALFPAMADPAAPAQPLARPELRGSAARKLLARHLKHNKPLVV